MVGQWVQAMMLRQLLIADKELPPGSKEEAERQTNWAKMAQAKRARQEHEHNFHQALASPRHFGAFMGMRDVLGEPDPETVQTFEEAEAERAEKNRNLPGEAKVYFMNDSILTRAAREGRGFSPGE